jgi:hypothetical protein
MNYEEDFYNECDECNQIIGEIKNSLKKSIKEEHIKEIEALRKENSELREVKNNWNNLKREFQKKIKDVEDEKDKILRNARQDIYNATLKDLFDNCNLYQKLYRLNYTNEKQKKCDKCNEKREYILTAPDGKNFVSKCKCSDYKKIYYVEEDDISYYIQKSARENDFLFSIRADNTYIYSSTIKPNEIINVFEFEKADKYSCYTYFASKEEAQKYCDYLNKKEVEE